MTDEPDTYFHCAVHPDKMGVKDLGMNEENRYPCKECYEEIVEQRKLNFIKKYHRKKEKDEKDTAHAG